MLKLVILFILITVNFSECAKILAVFPTPSISHQIVFRPLIHALVERGHHVTVITTDPEFTNEKRPKNLTEIDVHDISYGIWEKFLALSKGDEYDAQQKIKIIFQLLNAVFEEQLKSSEIQKLILDKNKTFDLLFVEACVRPAIAYSYIYKVPVIEISSLGGIYETFDNTGAPINPLIYPLPIRQRLNNLTTWERLSELRINYNGEQAYGDLIKSENEMLKRTFGQGIPEIRELKKNVHMLFLNVHPMWDFNRPVPPNVVYLGGLHQKPSKKLPHVCINI